MNKINNSYGEKLLKYSIKYIFHKLVDNGIVDNWTNMPRIIMYHGLSDAGLTIKCFEEQIIFFKRMFRIVSLEELISNVSINNVDRIIALTFDDALRNIYKYIYPILLKHRIPATIFVCPGLVEEQKWLWNNEARVRLQYINEKSNDIFKNVFNMHGSSVEGIIENMKIMQFAERENIGSKILKYSASYFPTEGQKYLYDVMSWYELNNMDLKLITVGSHTIHHPSLFSLDEKQIEYEIRDSKYLLENKLKCNIDYFCYPYGHQNKIMREIVRKYYKGAVSTVNGLIAPDDDLYNLKRISGGQNISLFIWRLYG